MSHALAAEEFARARNPDRGKLLERNTRLVRVDNIDYGVRLHETDIVIIHRDGTYSLFSGGWKTRTTLNRLNKYSPATITQRKGEWYAGVTPWNEGMRFTSDGRLLM